MTTPDIETPPRQSDGDKPPRKSAVLARRVFIQSNKPAGHSGLASNRAIPYIFSAPAILLVSAVLAFPVLYGLYKSLYREEFFGADEKFVGLDNYTQMLKDPEFHAAFEKTVIFVVGCLVLGTVLGLLFAFALNSVVSKLRFIRAISIAPYLISTVAAAVMFRMLFNTEFGLLNRVIEFFGFDGLRWLADPNLAMVTVIVCQVWTDLPLTILLLLAGLQAIDSAYLDAALVDGASAWKRAWHISIPLIMPQLVISTIWMSYSALTGLGTILALTGGGPLKATQTIPMEMYELAFDQLRMNEALAVATALLVLNALLTLVYYMLGRRYNLEDR